MLVMNSGIRQIASYASGAATAPKKNVALHHTNQIARRSENQKITNRTPSSVLMKTPNSRMVKASI